MYKGKCLDMSETYEIKKIDDKIVYQLDLSADKITLQQLDKYVIDLGEGLYISTDRGMYVDVGEEFQEIDLKALLECGISPYEMSVKELFDRSDEIIQNIPCDFYNRYDLDVYEIVDDFRIYKIKNYEQFARLEDDINVYIPVECLTLIGRMRRTKENPIKKTDIDICIKKDYQGFFNDKEYLIRKSGLCIAENDMLIFLENGEFHYCICKNNSG